MNVEILELITRRERQILVHSYIYYDLNTNLISDSTYDEWSKELAQLIKDNPEEFKKSENYQGFKGFDGSTGMDLPYREQKVEAVALGLLSYKEREEL